MRQDRRSKLKKSPSRQKDKKESSTRPSVGCYSIAVLVAGSCSSRRRGRKDAGTEVGNKKTGQNRSDRGMPNTRCRSRTSIAGHGRLTVLSTCPPTRSSSPFYDRRHRRYLLFLSRLFCPLKKKMS